jgi:hypothetical protein
MPVDPTPTPPEANAPARKPRRSRSLRLGCLVLLLIVCGGFATLVGAATAGPLIMPGGAELRAGAEDVVLSNFSFQNGTTYFLDLQGSGVRTIIETNYLEDTRTIEIVLRHSTREDRFEHRLLSWPLP